MAFSQLSRFNQEHPAIFSLLVIFIVSVVVYTTLRDFISYLVPFDYFWFVIFLTILLLVILIYLYEIGIISS